MEVRIEQLGDPRALSACEQLQQEIVGYPLISAFALVTLNKAGGLVLGAYATDPEPPRLIGTLIDLFGVESRVPSWCTVFHGVKAGWRNRGVGYRLRVRERAEGKRRGIARISWTIDPLRSLESHLAFNRLAAIAVGYERHRYGELADQYNRGLASDRLLIEWWIDSPRVITVIDRDHLPYHYRLGLEQMEVVTKTQAVPGGMRRLREFDPAPRGKILLAEIPADLDRLLHQDLAMAREWRLKTRELFERLFESGYTMTGFVHEAGRSFHLWEQAARKTVLERAT